MVNHNNASTITTPATIADTMQRSLVEAVDDGLLALGQIPRETVYHVIHTTHGVRREEIPEKLENFQKALREIFGTGTRVIERLIAKNLYKRLGLNFTEHKDWTLLDYVTHTNGGHESAYVDSKQINAAPPRITPGIYSGSFATISEDPVTSTRDRFALVSTRTSGFLQTELRRRLRTASSLIYTFPTITARVWRAPR